MPISGVSIFRELQSALENVRREATELRTDWIRLDTQIGELIAKHGSDLVDLSRPFLTHLARESIEGTLTQIQDEVRAFREQKERRSSEIAGQLLQLTEEPTNTSNELNEVTERLNEKVRQRDELQKQVATMLAESPRFQHLTEQAIASEEELHRNEKRVNEIFREANEKLPAYENSRLFQYLYRRNFGTPNYAHRGLTQRLDRWVGELIDIQRARRSYEFLKSTPDLMQAELTRHEEVFNQQMETVEECGRREADATGLTIVLQEGEQLGKRRDTLVTQLDRQQEQFRQVEQELVSLQQSQCQFYQEVLKRFRTFLSQTGTAVLEHHAHKTPETSDDELVSRIKWLTSEIDGLEPDVTRLSTSYKQLEEQATGLDFVVRRYQQSNFDSERSSFENGFDIEEYLDRFRKGVTDKDSLWQSIRRRQKFAPTWIEQTAGGASNALEHPLAQVLAQAMVQAAGAALQQSANRSVTRRMNGPSFNGGQGGGFTNGKGF